MRKYKEFPYPSKDELVVAYGRKGCPYCEKIKAFIDKFKNIDRRFKFIYHDIFDIIDSGMAKDVNDFKKKMRIFIGEYSMVPIIFIESDFIGGYTSFCDHVLDILGEKKGEGNIFFKEVLRLKKFSQKNVNEIRSKLAKLESDDKCMQVEKKKKETKNKKSK